LSSAAISAPTPSNAKPASTHAGIPPASGATAAAGIFKSTSTKLNSDVEELYCVHHCTPSLSSRINSLREPSSSSTKKLAMTMVSPLISLTTKSLPDRSRPATCSGPICIFTMLGASTLIFPSAVSRTSTPSLLLITIAIVAHPFLCVMSPGLRA